MYATFTEPSTLNGNFYPEKREFAFTYLATKLVLNKLPAFPKVNGLGKARNKIPRQSPLMIEKRKGCFSRILQTSFSPGFFSGVFSGCLRIRETRVKDRGKITSLEASSTGFA